MARLSPRSAEAAGSCRKLKTLPFGISRRKLDQMREQAITISGSYRKHFDRIVTTKREFEELGASILRPLSEEIRERENELVRLSGDPDDLREVQEAQLKAVSDCDLLYVVNPAGYVGPSATLEIGFAHALGKKIITSEPPFEAVVAVLVDDVCSPADAWRQLEGER